MQKPKLSIGDAIGLVTLRLGRLEEFMMRTQNQEGGFKSESSVNIPENSQLIDKSVFTNMISRLDSLEKKDSNKQIAALESELRSTKDLLISLMAKFEKFSKETDEKFADYDCAIAEIEGKMDSPSETVDETEEVVSSETGTGTDVEGISFEISE
jgi:vacuolar-type H+-ATPase subunit I/STV1